MDKAGISEALGQIATLLELKDENPFKIRAYANAARSIEAWGGSLSDMQDEEVLAKIPGIGKAIAAKIKELAGTGSLKYLEELRAEFPAAILQLFSIPGLGAKKIKALHEQLQISSIAELRKACESGRVAATSGIWRNDPGQDLPGDRPASEAFRVVSIRPDCGGGGAAPGRSQSPARARPGLSWPEVIGGEKRLCATSISSWQRRSRKRSRNFWWRIHWWNRSSPKGRLRRVCGFVPEFNAICA